jgi:hypothetical protein
MRGGRMLVVPALFSALSGCSLLASRSQTLMVSSSPSDAEVWVDEALVGRTPVEVRVERWRPVTVTLRKEGYRTVSRTTTRSLSGVGIFDVVGGSLVLLPYLGLLSGGAWEHSPSQIHANLMKK